MSDRRHEDVPLVPLERNHVGKTLEHRSPDRRNCRTRARPLWKGIGGFANSIKGRTYLGNKLVAQTNSLLVVPKGGTAKLRTRFRMQFDPHAAVRAPSGSRSGRSPNPRSRHDRPQRPGTAALVRTPTQPRLRRPTLPSWKAIARRPEHVRDEEDAALRPATPQSTQRQSNIHCRSQKRGLRSKRAICRRDDRRNRTGPKPQSGGKAQGERRETSVTTMAAIQDISDD